MVVTGCGEKSAGIAKPKVFATKPEVTKTESLQVAKVRRKRPMLFGYARVSTDDENLDLQHAALTDAVAEEHGGGMRWD